MIIYYEVIFFLNCFIHYVVSKITSRIYRIKLSYKRLFISFIPICLNMYLYINFDFMKYLKYFIGYLLSIITFKKKSFSIFLVYFSINVMIAGSYLLFNLYNYRYLILSCVIPIVFYEVLSYVKENEKKRTYYYKIMFKLDRLYILNAYLDTGNDLTEPKSNIPVIIINKEINYGKRIKIPYRTINDEGYLYGIYCKNFFIKKENKYIKKEVYLVCKNMKYECLLNVLLF